MSGDSSLLPLSTYLVLLYSDTTAQGGVRYVHFAAHSMLYVYTSNVIVLCMFTLLNLCFL